LEPPSEPPETAAGPRRETSAPVLALTTLAAAAAATLTLARGRALEDALGAGIAAQAGGLALLAFALGAGTLGGSAGRTRRSLAALGVLLLAALAFSLLWTAGLAHLRELEAGAPLVLLGLWLLVGPPAFLAGATLPFAARACAGAVPHPGASVLAAAALGAGAGRWVAAFHLVADVGLDATANVATALGLVLGALALALARARSGESAAAAEPSPPREPVAAPAALLGLSVLALQRLGSRELDLIAGPTAHSAWAAGAAFLALFGAGALVAAACRPADAPLAAALGTLGAVLGGVAGLLAMPALGTALGELAPMRAAASGEETFLALAALLQGAPALGLGLTFGLLAPSGGRELPRALSVGALGAAAGVLLLEVGPPLERQLALRVALGLIPVAVGLRFRPSAQPAVAVCGLLALGALAVTWGAFPARDRLVGSYLGRAADRAELAGFETILAAEGPRADVLALEQRAPGGNGGDRVLFVDGRRIDGGAAERALGWLPRLLHPRARRALIDGVGSGYVAGALLELGGLEVVCAEPLDALVAAAEHLGHLQAAGGPEFTRARADLRRHLDRSGPRYDLVLVDASAPWTRGATTRLSTEFFQAAGARLEAYGLVAVALPTDCLHLGQLALVIRTALGVFPDAALLDAGDGLALLVATPRGLVPGVEEIDAAQALLDGRPRAAAEVAQAFGSADVRTLLLERLWLGVEPLRAVAAGYGDGEALRDADLSLEITAFRGALFAAGTGDLLRAENERLLFSATDPELMRRLFVDWRASTLQLEALRARKTRYFKDRLFEQGLALVQLALAYEPDEPEFGADLLLFGDLSPQDFETRRRLLLRRSATETYRLGRALHQLGRRDQARAVLAGLVEQHPQSAIALEALADADEALGDAALAAAERDRARELDPLYGALLATE